MCLTTFQHFKRAWTEIHRRNGARGLHFPSPSSATFRTRGKGRGGKGGNYRRNAAREFKRFVEWAAGDRGDKDWTGIISDDVDREPTFEDLDERVFREYARHLAGDRGLKQNTVQTYYA